MYAVHSREELEVPSQTLERSHNGAAEGMRRASMEIRLREADMERIESYQTVIVLAGMQLQEPSLHAQSLF